MTAEPAGKKGVEVLEKRTPFQGYFRIDTYTLRHEKFDGGWTAPMTRELFERGHAAAVLPYDPARDCVVLIEQFRIGAYAAGVDPWMIEVVAGIIDEGEDPEDVVRREALEEAGCEIGELLPIGTFLLTPGGSSETLAIYCGRVDSAGLGGIYGLDHEGEDIRCFTVPTEEALPLVMAGPCPNANAVIPLQWLLLNRTELRRRWAPAVP
ncbi:MAG: NUDIX domain-containing protein [Gemmatimonadetes bacterium]|nr:NUDIX domain-containing protein [Gemmatimonadota bacterium]